ncbi:PREDICTED: uncharacterized protein LOC107172075 [Diuraphis noxia]|uniref:uncharacterized protein LOC107172075 n=1 Tax=Diuraphis noxia TaxID=143948 RepID=UPI0007639517|nr:PREDICTED: uncharacterized protein LOC107172075 [Diuraphis noxia]
MPSTSIQHNSESNISIDNTSSNVSPFHPLLEHIVEPNLSNEILLTPKVNLRNKDFKNDLSNWAIDCNVPQTTVNKLLQIMKSYEVIKTEDLPLDSRTLLAPPKSANIIKRIVIPGHYYHFGLANGIDGLPLSKSSNSQFWPILAYIVNDSKTVFPIGVYHGYTKPKNSDEFLLDFIEEAKCLMTNEIILNDRTLKITIHSCIADSPAKSFLLNTKGHSGYYSCYRCIEEGEYCGSNVCFPYSISKAAKRTHEDYVEMKYEDHHIGNPSKLIELPGIDLVHMVPLDYMHLV